MSKARRAVGKWLNEETQQDIRHDITVLRVEYDQMKKENAKLKEALRDAAEFIKDLQYVVDYRAEEEVVELHAKVAELRKLLESEDD